VGLMKGISNLPDRFQKQIPFRLTKPYQASDNETINLLAEL